MEYISNDFKEGKTRVLAVSRFLLGEQQQAICLMQLLNLAVFQVEFDRTNETQYTGKGFVGHSP